MPRSTLTSYDWSVTAFQLFLLQIWLALSKRKHGCYSLSVIQLRAVNELRGLLVCREVRVSARTCGTHELLHPKNEARAKSLGSSRITTNALRSRWPRMHASYKASQRKTLPCRDFRSSQASGIWPMGTGDNLAMHKLTYESTNHL